jgi:hypothetical protein
MKPIAYGHPFIMLGKDSLESLGQQGFYIFNDFFKQNHGNSDVSLCFNEILEISKLSLADLELIKKTLKDKIIHNYNRFWIELPKQDKHFINYHLKEKIRDKLSQLNIV